MRDRIWSPVSPASTVNGSTGVCRKRDFFAMPVTLEQKTVKLSTTEVTEDTEEQSNRDRACTSVSSVSSVVESLARLERPSHPEVRGRAVSDGVTSIVPPRAPDR